MRSAVTVKRPCVIWPARPGRDEEHIIHGTHWRAQRNAAATAFYGTRYHVHETEALTAWGWIRRALHLDAVRP